MSHAREMTRLLYKDEILDRLAEFANVAQFVSFEPSLAQRFARIHSYSPNHRFASAHQALAALLRASPERSINIRSFDPVTPESRDFRYGIRDLGQAIRELELLAEAGLYTIANETIDVNDGGVSGVILGDIIEFAPKDTPRAVEKPGVASLSRSVGLGLLRTVYGFIPALEFPPTDRVEFSLHPLRRGVRNDHTIVWQVEDVGENSGKAAIDWPNRFSAFIGDKVFGLLVASQLGLSVPRSIVLSRNVAPFSFGQDTGTSEPWIRTSPTEQLPGKYTTARGWKDPFVLMQEEDPSALAIASVLAQEGVDAKYSGALIVSSLGAPVIEGVEGFGDEFMIGRMAPSRIPARVLGDVLEVYQYAAACLGPVRFEWVHDGKKVWVVQLHRGRTMTEGHTIVPGDAAVFHPFNTSSGIDSLRALIEKVKGLNEGIALIGQVGLTSHFGDLLRRARIPARLEQSVYDSAPSDSGTG